MNNQSQKWWQKKKLHILFNSTITQIRDTEVELKINSDETMVIPNSYVFIFAGGEPPFPLMQKVGIQFGGELKT